MKAVQYDEYGGPEVLHVAEVEEPHAGPGQVRVAVRAAGVNPMDYKVRAGRMSGGKPPAAPTTTALDASGVVDEVGDGVTGVQVGDEVFGSAVGGAAAEYAVLAHWAAKPATMSFEEAAGLPVAVETSLRAFRVVGLKRGDTLLVNGAAGGVGLAAVQLALAEGPRTVVGTASEGEPRVPPRRSASSPRRTARGWPSGSAALVPDGDRRGLRHRRPGRAARPHRADRRPAEGRHDRRLRRGRVRRAPHHRRQRAGRGTRWSSRRGCSTEGRFSLPVAQSFPFEQAAEAHRLSEGGHVRGKLVLTSTA